jgi:hypothetical protein
VENGKVKGTGFREQGPEKRVKDSMVKALRDVLQHSVYLLLRFGLNIPITNPGGSFYGRDDGGVS